MAKYAQYVKLFYVFYAFVISLQWLYDKKIYYILRAK